MHLCTCICASVHLCICASVHLCTCMCACPSKAQGGVHLCTCARACVHVCMFICACVHVCTCMCACASVHVHLCTCICACACVHVHMCMHGTERAPSLPYASPVYACVAEPRLCICMCGRRRLSLACVYACVRVCMQDGLIASTGVADEEFRLAQFDALNSLGARRSEVWVDLEDHPW